MLAIYKWIPPAPHRVFLILAGWIFGCGNQRGDAGYLSTRKFYEKRLQSFVRESFCKDEKRTLL
ncbi:hypothetical protein I79_003381 [Cricetulus griseus]|uniref:Uncharacterized protein n=1 Tax=Cricetulus griseus TaxID=10029 RepID=G3GZT4_CRIGR|nr:hypothetical protein I79_003381 [Cricetulus griseus]